MNKSKTITKRQKDLLAIIYTYIQREGYPPTFKEMRERLDVISNQSVIDLLGMKEQDNLIFIYADLNIYLL